MKYTPKVQRIFDMKNKEKITMLTAYDYSMGALESLCKIDMVLVGDSANFILNGKSTTRGLSVDDMVSLVKKVSNGVKTEGDNYSVIIGDLPAGSYETVHHAVRNARTLIKAGADAVKLEGATEKPQIYECVKTLTKIGIPVQGHIGYTPQSEILIDKGMIQGKTTAGIEKLISDYKQLSDAGAFSIVLECVPWQVSKLITEHEKVPSIGIGAGSYCDGQVLVSYDFLGLSTGLPNKPGKFPKFVWQYNMHAPNAIKQYIKDVKLGVMPDLDHSYSLKDESILEPFLK